MNQFIYIGLTLLGGFLAWKFGIKKEEEKTANRAKVPDKVLSWEPEVANAAAQFDVPKSIAMSVMWTESAGNSNAVGSAGEKGLFQLKKIAVKDLKLRGFGKFPNFETKPEENIKAGVAYLKLQKENTGNWYDAVKAYNQGFQGMKDNPKKAQNYLDKIKQKEEFFS